MQSAASRFVALIGVDRRNASSALRVRCSTSGSRATPAVSPCDERYVRTVACANDAGIDCAYRRLNGHKAHRGEHTMKHTAVILGVAAAMGVFASGAAGSTGQPVKKGIAKPAVVKRTLPVSPALVLRTAHNSRTGQTVYRLGDKGLWME